MPDHFRLVALLAGFSSVCESSDRIWKEENETEKESDPQKKSTHAPHVKGKQEEKGERQFFSNNCAGGVLFSCFCQSERSRGASLLPSLRVLISSSSPSRRPRATTRVAEHSRASVRSTTFRDTSPSALENRVAVHGCRIFAGPSEAGPLRSLPRAIRLAACRARHRFAIVKVVLTTIDRGPCHSFDRGARFPRLPSFVRSDGIWPPFLFMRTRYPPTVSCWLATGGRKEEEDPA